MYAKYPSPLNTGIWQRIHFVFNKPIYEYNFKVYYEYWEYILYSAHNLLALYDIRKVIK